MTGKKTPEVFNGHVCVWMDGVPQRDRCLAVQGGSGVVEDTKVKSKHAVRPQLRERGSPEIRGRIQSFVSTLHTSTNQADVTPEEKILQYL